MNINDRWEKGIPHDPRSEDIGRFIEKHDKDNELGLRFGGDGDNGETILYLLDMYFEKQDKKEK